MDYITFPNKTSFRGHQTRSVLIGENINFRNHYICESCKEAWDDVWDCQVDDDCPHCGARHMSPIMSSYTTEYCEANSHQD